MAADHNFRMVRPLGRFGRAYGLNRRSYVFYYLWFIICIVGAFVSGVYFSTFYYWGMPLGFGMCGIGLIGLAIIARMGGSVITDARSNAGVQRKRSPWLIAYKILVIFLASLFVAMMLLNIFFRYRHNQQPNETDILLLILALIGLVVSIIRSR
jgi:hypothetical protein